MSSVNENHILIKEEVQTPILPSKKAELLRDISLKAGFIVHGAVYAQNMDIEGQGIVDGPVFAKKEIRIVPPLDGDDKIILRRGINAGRAILVEVSNLGKSSPVRDCSFTPLVVRGDICTGQLKLENALVFGNIHCENAYIKESIIIGSPIVASKLQIENSAMISFNAGAVEVYGRNTLWVPYGIARDSIEFCPVDLPETGQEVEDAAFGWIRYIGLCNSTKTGCGEPLIACDQYLDGTCMYRDIRFDPKDILNVKREDNTYNQILTFAPRILDLSSIEENLEAISQFIIRVLLFEHLDDASKEDVSKFIIGDDHMELLDQLTLVAATDEI